MAQFDVYRNKSARSRAALPFLIDVQTDLLEDLGTVVVIPLAKPRLIRKISIANLTPPMQFLGEHYVLLTPQLAGVARTELGPRAGNVSSERHLILAALDFLTAGF